MRVKNPDELRRLAGEARELLRHCEICPRRCKKDRLAGEIGTCGIGSRAIVAAAHPHFGEESPLVGRDGSGTIFFAGCNLRCVFCQNFDTSHTTLGRELSTVELAGVMLALQRAGCHNLNLVTPTHVVPQILDAIACAVGEGFTLPIVYNSSGYDRVETLRLLEGVVDIYMPDLKVWERAPAKRYLTAEDYPETARAALLEMHRQVGDLVVGEDGIARKGLLVRHLVMPGDVAGTREVLAFIAREISPHTYVNVMAQYRPLGYAERFPPIDRSITSDEYARALGAAREAGLIRLDRENLRGQ